MRLALLEKRKFCLKVVILVGADFFRVVFGKVAVLAPNREQLASWRMVEPRAGLSWERVLTIF